MFAAAHVPNPLLMGVTLVGGTVAAFAYQRHRNLFFLAFAHALIGTMLWLVVPDTVSHHLRVGPGMRRNARARGAAAAGGASACQRAWVAAAVTAQTFGVRRSAVISDLQPSPASSNSGSRSYEPVKAAIGLATIAGYGSRRSGLASGSPRLLRRASRDSEHPRAYDAPADPRENAARRQDADRKDETARRGHTCRE